MKARDVEIILRSKGYERGMREIIMQIIEEQDHIEDVMKEAIEAIYSMSTVIETLNTVANGMKYKIDRLSLKDEDGRSTQSIAEGD